MLCQKVYCWEPSELNSAAMVAAQKLYESTIDPDERIPWMWIERAVTERVNRRPGGWMKHLILASDGPNFEDPESLLGFAYGAFIPGFGGYLCYLGVSAKARKRGVGSRLFESVFKTFAADAALAGEPLPFVLWESYRPTPDDPAHYHQLWDARVKLFERVGGLRVGGLELVAPDYDEDDPADGVPLQLFIKPMDEPATAFTPSRLQLIAADLLEKVYQERPGDDFHDRTFATMTTPHLLAPAQPVLLAV